MATRKHYKVHWTHTASVDLESIVDFIARENVSNALDILAQLRNCAANLKSFPLRGRVVPELADIGVHFYREVISAPWRVIYRVADGDVYVMMVIDSRRNAEDLLLERFTR
ncbi:MAG: type II toxin-antitoxin system RelE/ParE family toxin [Candidatus Binatia bacterium]